MENITFRTVEEILEFALNQEEKAADLYLQMAQRSTKTELVELWKQLAHDEQNHKDFILFMLERIKTSELECCHHQPVMKDYEPLSIPKKEFSERERVMVEAIERDLEKVELYRFLAGKVTDVRCANMLLHIANQELIHKNALIRDLNMFNYYG